MAPLPPREPRARWCCLCPPCTAPPTPRAQHDTYRSQGTKGCASSGHRPLVTVSGGPGATRSHTADTGQEAAAGLRWPEPCHQGLTSHPVCCEVQVALQAPHAPVKKTEAQDVRRPRSPRETQQSWDHVEGIERFLWRAPGIPRRPRVPHGNSQQTGTGSRPERSRTADPSREMKAGKCLLWQVLGRARE